jgi:hypothetical protein
MSHYQIILNYFDSTNASGNEIHELLENQQLRCSE